MPKKLEDCVKQVKAQIEAKKTKVQKGKTADETAWAICNASLNPKESARWFQNEEVFFYCDPETFELTEVKKTEVPYGALHILEAKTEITPEVVTEANHSHEHIHAGMKPHTHAHAHSGEVILDKSHLKEDHAAHVHEAGDEPEAMPECDKESVREVATTSEMPVNLQAQPVEHEHPHMHGTMTHTHSHQHDQEHGIDGQMGKHDHPHEEETPEEDKKETPADEKAEDKKKESVRSLIFSDTCTLREAEIDKAHKTVGVTLIKPGWSVMGRYYSTEVLGRAIPLFEGTKCYIDHPSLSEEKDRPERSARDIAGYYRGVTQQNDGSLTAQLILIGRQGDDMWPLVQEAASKKPDLVGLSINALGKTRLGEVEGKQGVIVEELVKAFGTDIVTTPSAGGKFERLMQGGDEMTVALLQSLSYDEWRSANPDFEARIKKEMRTARKEELDSAAIKESEGLKEVVKTKDVALQEKDTLIGNLTETVKGLEQKLADQEQAIVTRVSEVTADLKLLQSKLPAEWCGTLRPQLLGKSAAEMDQVVETERKKYFSIKAPVTVTSAPRPSEVEPADPVLTGVLEALGQDGSIYPLENESPEEYARRKRAKSLRS
jgi:hypothetical protein